MEKSDIENLIARVALGDQSAFSALYDATSGKLLAVCMRILGQRSRAEDALQDAFIKIWKNADRFQVTAHSPMSWLVTIARNTAIDAARATRPEADISDHMHTITASGPTPEQSVVAASEATRVKGCLDELADDRRDAVVGVYLKGESYQDLATRNDVPLNTMRTWLRRSLIRLRECMSK